MVPSGLLQGVPPRTINSSSELGLDTIFNGTIKTSDLTYGSGMYRVYAALCDPDGEVLVTSDEVVLAAWWEFTADVE